VRLLLPFVAILLTSPTPVALGSKTEDALKVQVEQLQQQLAKSQADADVRKSVDKLAAQNKLQGHSGAADAADIRYTQNVNDEAARRAVDEAKDRAAKSDAIAVESQRKAVEQRSAEHGTNQHILLVAVSALITSFLGLLASIWPKDMLPLLWKSHIEERDRRWKQLDAESEARVVAAVKETGEKIIEQAMGQKTVAAGDWKDLR
jgi:hypothetical protein